MTSPTANLNLQSLRDQLEPLRSGLLAHSVYEHLGTCQALRTFMEYHVFAVWDFMSLLKSLQRRLTCVDVPWIPQGHSSGCRLVNEIVVGEESDADGQGGFASHFELYHRAMRRFGADTQPIDRFLARLQDGQTLEAAFAAAAVPEEVREFVRHTFRVIDQGRLVEIAAAFTFGREDLLPAVFPRIVERLQADAGGGLDDFRYYLLRHVELDGDEHGPLALRWISQMCDGDPERWADATQAAVASLAARHRLWDAIEAAVTSRST